MRWKFHVRFLGEGVGATSPPYPTGVWAANQDAPRAGERHPGAEIGFRFIFSSIPPHDATTSGSGPMIPRRPGASARGTPRSVPADPTRSARPGPAALPPTDPASLPTGTERKPDRSRPARGNSPMWGYASIVSEVEIVADPAATSEAVRAERSSLRQVRAVLELSPDRRPRRRASHALRALRAGDR